MVRTAGARFDDLIVSEPAAIDITLGGRPAATYREQSRSPSTRMAVVAQLRDLLVKAQEWMAGSAGSGGDAEGPRNLGMEALARMLRGDIPARVQANATRDIRVAIELAEEFGFELVIDGGAGAHQMADELAGRGIPVILGPISHPYISGEEIPNAGVSTAGSTSATRFAHEAGVHVSLASSREGSAPSGRGVAGPVAADRRVIASGTE